MTKFGLKYYRIIQISFFNSIEYRVDFLFGLLAKFFPIIIQYYMWTAIFKNSPDSIIMGYSYPQMIVYTIIAPLVSSLSLVNIQYQIADEIRLGRFSRYVILPAKHFNIKLSEFIGTKFIESIFISILLLIAGTVFFKAGYLFVNIAHVFLFILVIIFSIAIRFLIAYLSSAMAFWMGDCDGVFTMLNVIILIISGGVFPLNIFGNLVLKISQLLPFYYITYFPANILIKEYDNVTILGGIGIMLIWIVILWLICKLIWYNGEKKYIAAGG